MSRTAVDLVRDFAAPDDAVARSRGANRRRLFVFGSVFIALVAVGLVWDFVRPAVYEATARLDFVRNDGAQGPEAVGHRYALGDEVQYLTSRTLLAKVWNDLGDRPGVPAALAAGDPPATLQSMLTAAEVPGTSIVAIRAEGGDPAFLRTFVDRLIGRYRAGLDERFEGVSANALTDARDETNKLDAAVAGKRREVDAFRAKNDIVSLERDENQVLSEVKGTGAALNAANEKLAGAEAKLAALKDAQAAGNAVTRSRDPTLAALEQRAAGIRADLRATARQFTEQYMAIDPRIRAERAQLAEIDEQIAAVRRDSQQGALQEAQEELASARGAAAALRRQLAVNQGAVQGFTSHFNEYKALQEQLTHLEQLRQKATDRLSVLDAGERGRKPRVEVVEPPSVPQSPFRPLYARDAALVVMASLLAALAAMGIVEFFNRPPSRPSTVVIPQTWSMPIGFERESVALAAARPRALSRVDDRPTVDPAMLVAPLPRELGDAEVRALLTAADPAFRAVMAFLLTGVTAAEVVALRQGDVDRQRGLVTVSRPDPEPRSVRLPPHVVEWLPGLDEPADAPLFSAGGGRPLSEDTLRTALLYAAHDAGLDAADDVAPETLRHAYVAFLLRQGVRLADLARMVGPLPAERLAAYKRLAPGGPPTPPNDVERVLPALRAAT